MHGEHEPQFQIDIFFQLKKAQSMPNEAIQIKLEKEWRDFGVIYLNYRLTLK